MHKSRGVRVNVPPPLFSKKYSGFVSDHALSTRKKLNKDWIDHHQKCYTLNIINIVNKSYFIYDKDRRFFYVHGSTIIVLIDKTAIFCFLFTCLFFNNFVSFFACKKKVLFSLFWVLILELKLPLKVTFKCSSQNFFSVILFVTSKTEIIVHLRTQSQVCNSQDEPLPFS